MFVLLLNLGCEKCLPYVEAGAAKVVFLKEIQRGEEVKAPWKKWLSERSILDETLNREIQ